MNNDDIGLAQPVPGARRAAWTAFLVAASIAALLVLIAFTTDWEGLAGL